jgi:hypothetical protein
MWERYYTECSKKRNYRRKERNDSARGLHPQILLQGGVVTGAFSFLGSGGNDL